jgi:hypothetical protein
VQTLAFFILALHSAGSYVILSLKRKKTMYKIQWTHTPVALTAEQQGNLDRELELLNDDLDSASDLIFHTVFLTADDNSPIIIVDGREGVNDTLFLTYYENPKWTSLNDTD